VSPETKGVSSRNLKITLSISPSSGIQSGDRVDINRVEDSAILGGLSGRLPVKSGLGMPIVDDR